MTDNHLQRGLILYFRIAMGWTFLYAGLSQLMEPDFTAATFLGHTKTFHAFFSPFATPAMLPYTDFLVKWGHTLIGLSLIAGLFVRLSSVFGILLMITYYFAHMDFPYIDSHVNFLIDYHLVYAGVLVYLIAVAAGRVWGLDAWVENYCPVMKRVPALRGFVS